MNTPPQPPTLTNTEINTIISGIELKARFQYQQLDYADHLVIAVLREQKDAVLQELESTKNDLIIAKEQYIIIKQQLRKVKRKK